MEDKNQVRSPIIGISATLMTIESGSFMGYERAAVGTGYVEAIRLVGGIPLILPVIEGNEEIRQQMQLIDGLLLTGGYDVSPVFYKEEPQKRLGAIYPKRDSYEIQLLQIAKSLQKPILGICRGLQLLNVAFGGTLYQDLETAIPSILQHDQKARPDEAIHTVLLEPQTKLRQIFEEKVILTNSFHHQAIKDLAPDLIVNARTKDGMIEGVEGKGELFILGVQWHPELMFGKHPSMLKLFHAFVEAARREPTP